MQNNLMILVYYQFRGHAQVARHLLAYLQIPYTNIHIDKYDTQRQTLSSQIIQSLQGLKINKQQLPLLIHEGLLVYNLYPILAYLCYRYNRQDLLGANIYQKALVQQIAQIHHNRLPHTKQMMFGFMAKIVALPIQGLQLMPFIQQNFDLLIINSGYLSEISQYLIRQSQINFVFGNFTIVDLYYVQSSGYMVGMYGSLDESTSNQNWKQTAKSYSEIKREKGEQIKAISNLRVMKKYQIFMKNQPYYLKHFDQLTHYRIMGSQGSQELKLGLIKIWADDYSDI